MTIRINFSFTGGMILFGFLLMAIAAGIDYVYAENLFESNDDIQNVKQTLPGTTVFYIGAAAVVLGIIFRVKGWVE